MSWRDLSHCKQQNVMSWRDLSHCKQQNVMSWRNLSHCKQQNVMSWRDLSHCKQHVLSTEPRQISTNTVSRGGNEPTTVPITLGRGVYPLQKQDFTCSSFNERGQLTIQNAFEV